MKPRIYDLALIIGCVGTEDQDALQGAFNESLISTVREAGVLSESEWQILPALIIALRFYWFSEWLRRNDEDMISFELFYVKHLMEMYYPEIEDE